MANEWLQPTVILTVVIMLGGAIAWFVRRKDRKDDLEIQRETAREAKRARDDAARDDARDRYADWEARFSQLVHFLSGTSRVPSASKLEIQQLEQDAENLHGELHLQFREMVIAHDVDRESLGSQFVPTQRRRSERIREILREKLRPVGVE